jgi:predicted O-methyltransferase YrrM
MRFLNMNVKESTRKTVGHLSLYRNFTMKVTELKYGMYTEDFTTPHIAFWKMLFKEHISQDRINPMAMLEIGSFEGQSTKWFIQNLLHQQKDKIHCIDPHWWNPGDAESKFWRSILEANGISKLTKHKNIAERAMAQFFPETFDVIYVDGNHNGKAVLLDALNSFRVVKVGGIILFDDYTMPANTAWGNFDNSTKKGIDTFVDFYRSSIELIAEDSGHNCSQIAFKRIK